MQQVIALIIFWLFAAAGIALSALGIAGTFLILLAAALYDLIMWQMIISWQTLAILAGLALLGELLEWIITYVGMKKNGVSRYGLIGTILGGIIGASLLSIVPILGTIVGLVAGAALGAWIGELYHTRHAKKAWKAAKAALIGRAIVMFTKLIIAIVQIAIILRSI
ncbi:DUF456 family protein [Candidatus Woesearchaeota archaeon]|nr:DUF456 family protein [Candidatus Woesearchaeota archaeon]